MSGWQLEGDQLGHTYNFAQGTPRSLSQMTRHYFRMMLFSMYKLFLRFLLFTEELLSVIGGLRSLLAPRTSPRSHINVSTTIWDNLVASTKLYRNILFVLPVFCLLLAFLISWVCSVPGSLSLNPGTPHRLPVLDSQTLSRTW